MDTQTKVLQKSVYEDESLSGRQTVPHMHCTCTVTLEERRPRTKNRAVLRALSFYRTVQLDMPLLKPFTCPSLTPMLLSVNVEISTAISFAPLDRRLVGQASDLTQALPCGSALAHMRTLDERRPFHI